MTLDAYLKTMYNASNRLCLLGVTKHFEKWRRLAENTQNLVDEDVNSRFTYNKCERFNKYGLVERGELLYENSDTATAAAFRTTDFGEKAKKASLYHSKYLVENDLLDFDLVVSKPEDEDNSVTVMAQKVLRNIDDLDSLRLSSTRLGVITQALHPEFLFRTSSLVMGDKAYKIIATTKPVGPRNEQFMNVFSERLGEFFSPLELSSLVDSDNPTKALRYFSKNRSKFMKDGVIELVNPYVITPKGKQIAKLFEDIEAFFAGDNSLESVSDDYATLYTNPPSYIEHAYKHHKKNSAFEK